MVKIRRAYEVLFLGLFLFSAAGATDNVVMLGAHLDSVQEAPGVNDDGSGSAALLELGEDGENEEELEVVEERLHRVCGGGGPLPARREPRRPACEP